MSNEQQGKPTPTQDEMDRHARGERLNTHEPDGSPEQPNPHARVLVPEGMNHVPHSEEAVDPEPVQPVETGETKKSEADDDADAGAAKKEKEHGHRHTRTSEAGSERANYKTRQSEAEKSRKAKED